MKSNDNQLSWFIIGYHFVLWNSKFGYVEQTVLLVYLLDYAYSKLIVYIKIKILRQFLKFLFLNCSTNNENFIKVMINKHCINDV